MVFDGHTFASGQSDAIVAELRAQRAVQERIEAELKVLNSNLIILCSFMDPKNKIKDC